jgi:transcriptional regulator with XRE-family HTH domain
MIVKEAIGLAIRARRSIALVSLNKLANQLDENVIFISRVERGVVDVSLWDLCRIAEALDIKASSLVADIEKLSRSYLKDRPDK